MIVLEYEVIEHYDNEPPEPFGFECLPAPPRVGSVILLHWLDGRAAYHVRVDKIVGTTLHVRKTVLS